MQQVCESLDTWLGKMCMCHWESHDRERQRCMATVLLLVSWGDSWSHDQAIMAANGEKYTYALQGLHDFQTWKGIAIIIHAMRLQASTTFTLPLQGLCIYNRRRKLITTAFSSGGGALSPLPSPANICIYAFTETAQRTSILKSEDPSHNGTSTASRLHSIITASRKERYPSLRRGSLCSNPLLSYGPDTYSNWRCPWNQPSHHIIEQSDHQINDSSSEKYAYDP